MVSDGARRARKAPASLRATINPDTTVTRVRLAGELDMATECELDPIVEQVLESAPEVVLLDVSDLEFCDARGLAGLVKAHERLEAADRHLALTGASPALCRLLEVTSLDRVLRVQ
jgi:anti-sigma B factor antagonist